MGPFTVTQSKIRKEGTKKREWNKEEDAKGKVAWLVRCDCTSPNPPPPPLPITFSQLSSSS